MDRQTRDQREILRFMYQTSAKGNGKGYQDWLNAWRQCKSFSVNVNANSLEGALPASFMLECVWHFGMSLLLSCTLKSFLVTAIMTD